MRIGNHRNDFVTVEGVEERAVPGRVHLVYLVDLEHGHGVEARLRIGGVFPGVGEDDDVLGVEHPLPFPAPVGEVVGQSGRLHACAVRRENRVRTRRSSRGSFPNRRQCLPWLGISRRVRFLFVFFRSRDHFLLSFWFPCQQQPTSKVLSG